MPQAVYWRRRAVALLMALAILSLIAWALSGALDSDGIVTADRAGSGGVPTVIPISWNRQASAPGCTTPAAHSAPGTYTATAVDGSLASNTISFRLG
jgi:hypothetical protein